MTLLTLSATQIRQLDLIPITHWLEGLPPPSDDPSKSPAIAGENQLQLQLDLPREADDPRELSEIPECRLWYIRLDSCYPWFPLYLDWKAGELARYAAMLVPHEFHRTEGIQFNPEALEIFTMHKVFTLADWLKQQAIPQGFRLKSFAQLLGYDLADDFLAQL